MKKALLILTAIISFVNAFSQNLNPYEQFGYKTKNNYVLTKNEGIEIKNKDKLSKSKLITIDLKGNQIIVYDNKNQAQIFNVLAQSLVRFISVDPLTKNYPGWSPYPFGMDGPIDGVDLDGKEWSRSTTTDATTGKTTVNFNIDVQIANNDGDLGAEKIKNSVQDAQNILTTAFNANADKNTIYTLNINYTTIAVSDVDKAKGSGLVLEFIQNGGLNENKGNNQSTTQTGLIRLDPYAPSKSYWDSKSNSMVTKSSLYSDLAIGAAISHEFLHGAKLRHPSSENQLSDIAQYQFNQTGNFLYQNNQKIRSSVLDETIYSNIMNTGANPIGKLQVKNFEDLKTLTLQQVERVNQVVQFEQKP